MKPDQMLPALTASPWRVGVQPARTYFINSFNISNSFKNPGLLSAFPVFLLGWGDLPACFAGPPTPTFSQAGAPCLPSDIISCADISIQGVVAQPSH